jgi:hypothetical protein
MFNSQLGQALFEILPGEVSSPSLIKILGVPKQGKNHALDHGTGLFRGSFTTWRGLYPLGYIINHN